ncbi:MAG: FAD-dependent thymidylate synthase [Clostridiales bacterium]|nr:FAD-dependent thymidylate synthase [Clostridiales bacterium]
MKVKLLSHTPDPDRLVAVAAKLCYSASDIDQLEEKQTPDKVEEFLDRLVEIGHESPVEHASFTFAVEGVSRSLLAQITRHRIASFSVQSQRYVDKSNFEYILPPQIEAIPDAKAEFIAAMEEDAAHYESIRLKLIEGHTKRLVDEGTEETQARRQAEKMANEDARYVLSNACDTKIIMTMNVRSLYNFFRLRCCRRAQWEIRALATEMLKLCKSVSPLLFRKAGPSCVWGGCSEGKMYCGHIDEVRKEFREMK